MIKNYRDYYYYYYYYTNKLAYYLHLLPQKRKKITLFWAEIFTGDQSYMSKYLFPANGDQKLRIEI